jgi:hypothetical protein
VLSLSFADQEGMLQFSRSATEFMFADHVERTNDKNWKMMMPIGVSGFGVSAVAYVNFSIQKSLLCTQFALLAGATLLLGTQLRSNNVTITDRDAVLRRTVARGHADGVYRVCSGTERSCNVSCVFGSSCCSLQTDCILQLCHDCIVQEL